MTRPRNFPDSPEGVVCTAELRAAGIESAAVRHLVRAGELFALFRGWYATRIPVNVTDRHLLMATAAARHYAGSAVLSHHSMLVCCKLPVYRADLSVVTLTRVSGANRKLTGFAHLHRPVPGARLARVGDGLLGLTLDVAIVQAGLRNGQADFLMAADAALRRRLVSRDRLNEAIEAMRGSAGISAIRHVAHLPDARHESPAESRLRLALHQLGIAVTPQFEVMTARGPYRADFRVDGHRVLLEVDGRQKYVDPSMTRGRDVGWEEKLRQDALYDEFWETGRFIWQELSNLPLIGRRVEAAIGRAATRLRSRR